MPSLTSLRARAAGLLALTLALPLPAIHAAPLPSYAVTPSLRLPSPTAALPVHPMLPLAFEPNEGQAPPAVRFLLRGAGYTLFLTARNLTLAVPGHAPQTVPLDRAGRPLQIQPSRPLPGVVNYLLGHDPHAWHTGIHTYAQVTYRDLLPGLGLTLSAGPTGLRATLTPRRPATAAVTAWTALAHRLTALGWQVTTATTRSPLAQSVSAPALSYATYLGGTNNDSGNAIAVDAQGDAYVTGATQSADLPVTPGAFRTKADFGKTGLGDAFVAALAPGGGHFLYMTYLATGGGEGSGIAVDAQGNAYVTGFTSSTSFPVTPGAYQTTCGGACAFALKLAPGDGHFLYSTYLGASTSLRLVSGNGIALDAQGDAYITASSTSVNWVAAPKAALPTQCFGNCVFVAALSPAGHLLYSTYLGSRATASGIAVDASRNAYVVGGAGAYGFPVTPGALQPTCRDHCTFVAKLAPGDGHLLYSTYLGGKATAGGIAVDALGDATIAGDTGSSSLTPTPGAYQTTCHTHCAYVARLAPDGSHLLFVTYLGDGPYTRGVGIAVDSQGAVSVTGATGSSHFPVTSDALEPRYRAAALESSAFVARLSPDGSRLLYSTYLGGSNAEDGTAIALDGQGDAYVTGETWSRDFPVTPGALQAAPPAGALHTTKAFVVRLIIPAAIPAALDPISPPPAGTPNLRYFPDTHHSLAGPFLAFWQSHGDLALLGLPLSQPFTENGQTVQYTERARLVLSHGAVSLSPLGSLLTAARAFPPAGPVSSIASRLYFPSTGHTLTAPFLTFWQQHNGSALFGPPISQPLRESNGDGSGRVYLVQYFANARLEYHPETKAALYQIQPGRLGYEYLHLRGLL